MLKSLKFTSVVFFFLAVCCLSGCHGVPANDQITPHGRGVIIDLPENTKLVSVSCQDGNITYVYRQRRADEQPEEYTLKQSQFSKSSIIREH